MYIRRFTYKKEDVGCKLCTEFRGRKKCPHKICPYITERIEAGAVTYQEAVNAMVHSGCQLIRRLPKLMQTYSGSFWLDDRHKSRMKFFNTRMGYSPRLFDHFAVRTEVVHATHNAVVIAADPQCSVLVHLAATCIKEVVVIPHLRKAQSKNGFVIIVGITVAALDKAGFQHLAVSTKIVPVALPELMASGVIPPSCGI